MNTSPDGSTSETSAMVCCPLCRGVTGFIERHQPQWPFPGPTYDFVHHCAMCVTTGRVSREVARDFWIRCHAVA